MRDINKSQRFMLGGVVVIGGIIVSGGETVGRAVVEGVKFCALSVVPAIFPFIVVSNLFVMSGAGEIVGGMFRGIFWKVFALSGSSATAVILGAICGFPVGAKTAGALYKRGDIDKEETERLIGFCNNTGPAFIINGIGGMWGSRAFGISMYVVQIVTAMVIGVVMSIGKRQDHPDHAKQHPDCPGHAKRQDHSDHAKQRPDHFNNNDRVQRLSSVLCESVCEGAYSMLMICGFIIFFGVISKVVVETARGSELVGALISSIFEFSSGAGKALEIEYAPLAAGVVGIAVGWGGLSVHAQTASIFIDSDIIMTKYYICKAVQGIMCGVTMYVITKLMGWSILAPTKDGGVVYVFGMMENMFPSMLCIWEGVVLMAGSIVYIFMRREKKLN